MTPKSRNTNRRIISSISQIVNDLISHNTISIKDAKYAGLLLAIPMCRGNEKRIKYILLRCGISITLQDIRKAKNNLRKNRIWHKSNELHAEWASPNASSVSVSFVLDMLCLMGMLKRVSKRR